MPISSCSGETDSGLISSLDADPSERPGLPNSPVMGRTPSNQGSVQGSIQSLSDGFPPYQPRAVDFNGRSSNEARSSMTVSPSGRRRDDPRFRLSNVRSHDEQ